MPHVVVEKRSRFSGKTKTVLSLIGLALLVCGVAFGIYVWRQALPKPNSDKTLLEFRAGRLPLKSPETLMKLEAAASQAGNHDDQIALWEAASSTARYQGKNEHGINDALEAEKLGTDHAPNALAIATLYRNNLHDNTNALKYYKLALDRTKKEQERKDIRHSPEEITYLETQIKALESGSGN